MYTLLEISNLWGALLFVDLLRLYVLENLPTEVYYHHIVKTIFFYSVPMIQYHHNMRLKIIIRERLYYSVHKFKSYTK